MKILCIGGAGYVGSACLRWLVRHGHDAVAFDNLCEGNAASVPSNRLVRGDLHDVEELTRVMRSGGFDGVIHFAAFASVPESIREPERYYHTNVVGSKNVLDAMSASGVKRIVFSSTCATYALDNDMPLTEASKQDPQHPYGRTKLAVERMIQDYAKAHDFGYAILRYFNASGADEDGEHGEDRRHEFHLIPLTLFVPLGKREKLSICGDDWDTPDGTCIRDYVHTADLAQAHQLAMEALVPGDGRIYNVGSGAGASVREVLRVCEEVVGHPIPHEIVARRPGDPARLVASSEKIERELGWKPRFRDVHSIVETAWRWHSSHPDGYAV